MLGIFKNAKFWIGVGAFAGGLFVTSKCARKIAVKGMAAGMQTRDNIKAGWDNVKEEANDIYEEAKEEVAAKADGASIVKAQPVARKTSKPVLKKKK